MLSIGLNNLSFFAHHGLYEEERILGNQFTVNLQVQYEPDTVPVQHLDQTIDYTGLFHLVQEAMSTPFPLLETLVTTLGEEVRQRFPQVRFVNIAITKQRPPVEGWIGDVTVRYLWETL